MPLDPSIILQSRPAQLDNPMDLRARALQLRQLGLATDQAQLETQQNRTLSDLYRRNTSADGAIDQAGVLRGMAASGLGNRIPAYQQQMLSLQKGQADLGKTQADTSRTQLETTKERLGIVNGALASLLSKDERGDGPITHQDVIGAVSGLVDQGALTPELGAQIARGMPGRPEQLRSWLTQKALEGMDAAKRLELLTPQYNEQDRGGVINEGTVDRLTGKRTAGADIAKSMTPDQAAKVQMFHDRGMFTNDAGDLLAALAAKGVSLPAGMRSKEQQIATVNGLIRKFPGMSPDEIADGIATGQIDFGAAKKETTTAAAQSGRVKLATQELNTFGDQVSAASKAVPRGNFVPWSRLQQMSDAQISDPALLEFKVKMQALNNAYDQLAARGGTDADKRAHIHELFNTANSDEAVQRLIKAIKDEASAAEQAAGRAMKYHPSGATETPPPAAGATTPGARPPLSAFQGR